MTGDWRNNIRALCKKKELSFAELSRLVGADDSYISKLLAGEGEPSVSKCIAIVDALDSTFGEVFLGDPLSGEREQLIRAVATLDEDKQAIALRLIKSLAEDPRDQEPSA